MYKNNPHFSFHSLMTRLIFSIIILAFALLSCRQSEPNPVLGAWLPDSNLNTKIVFSDSLEVHNCNGVKKYRYELQNYGKELVTDSGVYFLYMFEDKIRVSKNNKRIILQRYGR